MKPLLIILISLIVIAGSALWYFSDTVSASIAKIKTSLTKTTVKSANNTGLVGYWNFDDCDTCSTANDLSGNRNNGTFQADAAHTANGKINRGATFDGTGDYVLVTDSATLDLTNAITLSAWIQATNVNRTNVIFTKHSNLAGGSGYVLFQNSDNKFYFQGGDGTTWPSLNAVSTGTYTQTRAWHHVVGTFNGTTGYIYVDGEQVGTDTAGALVANNLNLWIGDNVAGSGAGSGIIGSLDEVRIYNRVLSAAEVKGLYEDTKRFFVNMPMPNLVNDGLIGFWSFNGKDMDFSAANEVLDRGSGGNNGDLISMNTTSVIPGIMGQALDFDGSADYVDAGTSVLSGNTGAFSTSVWFKSDNILNTTSASVTIVSKDDRTTGALKKMFQVQATGVGDTSGGSTLVGYVWDESASAYLGRATTITFNAGQWYHMVFTYDGTTNQSGVLLYINGVQYSTANYSGGTFLGIDDTSANFLVGAYTAASAKARFFNGQIDEVRVYNRAISANEVTELYLAGKRE